MRMLRISVVALFGASMGLGLFASPAAAETRTINLNGYDEVPVVITDATGRLQVKIASDESKIDYTLSYEGIEGGPVLQAHIHLGQKHTTGQIVVYLCTNVGGAPVVPPPNDTPECPAGPDGTVSGALINANVIPRPAQGANNLADVIQAIRKGVAYANVHTTVSTSGEIRQNFKGSH